MEEIKLDSKEYIVLEDEYSTDRQNRYILAIKGLHGVAVEYVTWVKNDRGLALGNYFSNYESALKDFKKRIR